MNAGSLIAGYRRMFELLELDQRRAFVSLVALVVTSSVLEMAVAASVFPYVATLGDAPPEFVRSAAQALHLSPVVFLTSCVCSLIILRFLTGVLLAWKLAGFQQHVQQSFIVRLFQGYLLLDWSVINSRHSASILKFCNVTALDAAHACQQLVWLLASGVLAVSLTVLVIAHSPGIAFLLAVILIAMISTMHWLLTGRQRRASDNRESALRRLHVGLAESISALREIRVYGAERYFLGRVRNDAQEVADSNRILSVYPYLPNLTIEFIALTVLLVVVAYWEVADLDLQSLVPHLVFYAIVARRLLPAVGSLLNIKTHLDGALINIELIQAEIRMCELHRSSNGILSVDCDCPIRINDIRVVQDGIPVLNGINLEIRPRQWVALTGHSGCGKSTLLDVIVGLKRPDHGSIDSGVGQEQSRSDVVYVSQHAILLDESVQNNIVFGCNESDSERMLQVLEVVQLMPWYAHLPEGLATRVGENGAKISGGERQRLALARALYRGPKLLIMDEATSALDEVTEANLLRAMRESYPGMTVMFVTHRTGTLAVADAVYQMDNGDLTRVEAPSVKKV